MLQAKYACSGKSHIGKHLQKMGYKTLFLVPQNMSKQEIDCDAETLISFFKAFQYSKVIVFPDLITVVIKSWFLMKSICQFRISYINSEHFVRRTLI